MSKLYISQIAAYMERMAEKARQIIVTKEHPEIQYTSHGENGMLQKALPMILICDRNIAIDTLAWSDSCGLLLNAHCSLIEKLHNSAGKSLVILWDTGCEVAQDRRGIYVDAAGAQETGTRQLPLASQDS